MNPAAVTKRKILFIISEPLREPYTGVTLPVIQCIRALCPLFECHVVVVAAKRNWRRSDSPLLASERFVDDGEARFWKFLFWHKPHFVVRRETLRRALLPLVTALKPDLIHADLLLLAEARQALAGVPVPAVLSLVDSLAVKMAYNLRQPDLSVMQRVIQRLTYLRVTRYEAEVVRGYDLVRLVSDYDTRRVAAASGAAQVICIPNSVDAGAYRFTRAGRQADRLLYVGQGGGGVERELRGIIGDIEAGGRPPFTYRIVGRGYSRRFQAFCRARPWVDFIGEVERTAAEYAAATLFLNPNGKPCGMYNKYLEAMACGLPCAGAYESFNAFRLKGFAGPSHYLEVPRENVCGFLAAALADRSLLDALAEAAYGMVTTTYSEGAQRDLIVGAYAALAGRSQSVTTNPGRGPAPSSQ